MKQLKNLAVILIGLVCIIYLLNPSAGFIELIPDNFPIIGNLDEAAAVLIILRCLAYFGLDLHRFFPKR